MINFFGKTILIKLVERRKLKSQTPSKPIRVIQRRMKVTKEKINIWGSNNPKIHPT